jgi:hypothetical protein
MFCLVYHQIWTNFELFSGRKMLKCNFKKLHFSKNNNAVMATKTKGIAHG